MRLILMGTGPFAVPTFDSLFASEHRVVAVVTRPIPTGHGRRKGPENPVLQWARTAATNIWQPGDINDAMVRQQLAETRADLMVVCDYGRILAADTLAVTRLGGINLHGSLLPKYRGAAPINWAIWNGEPETGVTVIHMTPKLDAGPALTTRRTPINSDEDAVRLEQRLAQLGVDAVGEAVAMLDGWDGHSPLGKRQDPALASRAPRLKKPDGVVKWSDSAERIRNQVRALKPWPGTYTRWSNGKRDVRLILDHVSLVPDTGQPDTGQPDTGQPDTGQPDTGQPDAGQPGRVARSDGRSLWIATGQECLALERIQPAGKRVMDIEQFLRGYPVQPGDKFSD